MRASRALAALALLAAAAPARAGWWDDAAHARETTLAAVRAEPERWSGVTVSLVVRFVGADPAAGATSLTGDGAAARGFAASAVSVKEARTAGGAPFDRFVVRRGSAEDARLAALRAGDEVRVRAVVRDAPGGPLLDVVWLSGPADALSPEETAAVARAEELVRRDNPAAAEPLLRGVLGARELAPPLRADLERRVARVCRAQGKREETVAALRRVVALDPEDVRARAELAAAEDGLRRAPPKPAGETSARPSRPLPPAGAPEIPVPAPAVKLAGPRDERPAPAAQVPSSAPASASPPAPVPPPPPASSPPSAPSDDAPPPPPRLAPPK